MQKCLEFSAQLAAGVLLLVIGVGAQASTVRIQEVLYDGPGADSDDVFTELYGTAGLSLDGWQLRGVNGGNGDVYRVLDLSGAFIPDDGLLVIATASANSALAAVTDWVANVDWQNGPDAVQLWFGDSLMDSLQYGDAGINNAGEGQPAMLVDAGVSLSRDASGQDTGNNAVDFSASVPAPGQGPSPVPVPAAAWLLMSGLAGLSVVRKR